MTPRMIGLRVHFASLLTSETYTGTIAGKHRIFDTYMVKLDTGRIITNVLYYDSEPTGEIPASSWQVCWPTGEGVLPGEHEELT